MRTAVVLSDWTSVELEVSSYEFFADCCLVVHFEDSGVQTFLPGEWIDVHRPRRPESWVATTRLAGRKCSG